MANTIVTVPLTGAETYKALIPDIGNEADIQTAFKIYHFGTPSVDSSTTPQTNSIAAYLNTLNDTKAPIASPAFTGTINTPIATGYLTSTSGVLDSIATIPNAGLTNSKITIGSTDVSLGETVTDFAGLTSITSTKFIGNLRGDIYASDAVTLVVDNGSGPGNAKFYGYVEGTSKYAEGVLYYNSANSNNYSSITPTKKIYVGQQAPSTANDGDIWMW